MRDLKEVPLIMSEQCAMVLYAVSQSAVSVLSDMGTILAGYPLIGFPRG